MPDEIVIGIDLGTTNSEVAVWRDGRVEVLEEDGTALLPSVVGLSPEGKLLVGQQARNQYVLYPDRTVKSVKRLMGSGQHATLGGKSYSPQELSALILRALKERAERILNATIGKAVITVPAYFSDAQRQATRDAGQIAGLEVVRMIHEPTAAVLAYEAQDSVKTESETVLVYDLGGGTLDVSIVQVQGDVTEVLASHGDTQLGGDDFDRLVSDTIFARMRETLGIAPRADDLALKNRVLRAAEEAKKRLSTETETVIREEYVGAKNGAPVHLEMTLTRDQLEALVRPLLDRSLLSVQKTLEGANKKPAEIDRVLLVGGSTRMPLVAALLEKVIGKAPRKDIHPDLCVAQGAGVMAARQMGRDVEKVLVDVTPYTFGTSALGELDGFPTANLFVPIIQRNVPLPCAKAEEFYTASDYQETVDVRVYQGENRDARRNILVGRFTIGGLSKVPSGNPIRMKMELDISGILKVTAMETLTGLSKTVTIADALSAMSAAQLEASKARVGELSDADEFDEADADDAGSGSDALDRAFAGFDKEGAAPGEPEAVAAGSVPPAKAAQARALLEKAERLLPKMHADDRAEAQTLLAAVRTALDAHDATGLETHVEELGELLFFVEENA